jgi:hypothetical protein
MAISVTAVAYGAVAIVGVTLFAIGTPAQRAAEMKPAITPVVAQSAPSPSVAAGEGITLRSVNLSFPSSDRSFPGGAAADAITANCTACHSPGMVLEQPTLTASQWQAEVNHMRNDFKAPVADADVPAILAYLEQTKGAK